MVDGPWHCKDAAHLSVRVTPARPTQTVTATFQANMSCINTPPYSGWGVVLSKRVSDPFYGMHLLPQEGVGEGDQGAIEYLVARLRIVANKAIAPQTVSIRHTSNTDFITFACVTKAAALTLATAIETAAAQAP